MRILSEDASRCENTECHMKETCLRWLALEDDYSEYIIISCFKLDKDGECQYYIKHKNEE